MPATREVIVHRHYLTGLDENGPQPILSLQENVLRLPDTLSLGLLRRIFFSEAHVLVNGDSMCPVEVLCREGQIIAHLPTSDLVLAQLERRPNGYAMVTVNNEGLEHFGGSASVHRSPWGKNSLLYMVVPRPDHPIPIAWVDVNSDDLRSLMRLAQYHITDLLQTHGHASIGANNTAGSFAIPSTGSPPNGGQSVLSPHYATFCGPSIKDAIEGRSAYTHRGSELGDSYDLGISYQIGYDLRDEITGICLLFPDLFCDVTFTPDKMGFFITGNQFRVDHLSNPRFFQFLRAIFLCIHNHLDQIHTNVFGIPLTHIVDYVAKAHREDPLLPEEIDAICQGYCQLVNRPPNTSTPQGWAIAQLIERGKYRPGFGWGIQAIVDGKPNEPLQIGIFCSPFPVNLSAGPVEAGGWHLSRPPDVEDIVTMHYKNMQIRQALGLDKFTN